MRFFQARILEWVAISFSRGSSQPRNRTWVSCTGSGWSGDEVIITGQSGKSLKQSFEIGMGFPCSSVGKESACSAEDLGSIPGLGRSPGERNGYPLQYPCLEKSHGQRSLVGCSPWGRKESGTSEWLTLTYLSSKSRIWFYLIWDKNLIANSLLRGE